MTADRDRILNTPGAYPGSVFNFSTPPFATGKTSRQWPMFPTSGKISTGTCCPRSRIRHRRPIIPRRAHASETCGRTSSTCTSRRTQPKSAGSPMDDGPHAAGDLLVVRWLPSFLRAQEDVAKVPRPMSCARRHSEHGAGVHAPEAGRTTPRIFMPRVRAAQHWDNCHFVIFARDSSPRHRFAPRRHTVLVPPYVAHNCILIRMRAEAPGNVDKAGRRKAMGAPAPARRIRRSPTTAASASFLDRPWPRSRRTTFIPM